MTSVSRTRRLWRLFRIVVWMKAGIVISLREHLFYGKNWHSTDRGRNIIQSWVSELAKRLRLQIRISGEPTDVRHVQISNHISWLDIVVLGSNHPVNFVAKAEIASWPMVGFLAGMAGTCFLERTRLSSLRNLMPVFLKRYKAGNNLVLFPEGTTSIGEQVNDFHTALFQIIIDAEIPVQPVALSYRGCKITRRKAAYIENDHFLPHLWSLCALVSIEVELHYMPVMKTRNKKRRLLALECRDVIDEQLCLLQGKQLTQAA